MFLLYKILVETCHAINIHNDQPYKALLYFNYPIFKTGWTPKYSSGIWAWTMTKSFIIMKSPIKADFQQQKAYAELI